MTHLMTRWRRGAPYACARWAYQPLKHARHALRAAAAGRAARATVAAHRAGPGFKGLHVGCGPYRIDGWLNADLLDNPLRDLYVDITRPLPFPDGCLDAVYASEVIEHVPEPEGQRFLREAARVLKPSGIVRLTTPNLRDICRLYLGLHPGASIDRFGAVWQEDVYTPERWVNGQFRHHGHRFLWSEASLAAALREAGFATVTPCAPRQTASGRPEMANLERHYELADSDWAFARTAILEASKQPAPTPRAAALMPASLGVSDGSLTSVAK
jgi:predicted SAM-dependent methyltransferase